MAFQEPAKKVELTREAWKTCKDKPSVRLMTTLDEASPGEEIVIVGEEDFAPFNIVYSILERMGFEVLDVEDDGYYYKLRVAKR